MTRDLSDSNVFASICALIRCSASRGARTIAGTNDTRWLWWVIYDSIPIKPIHFHFIKLFRILRNRDKFGAQRRTKCFNFLKPHKLQLIHKLFCRVNHDLSVKYDFLPPNLCDPVQKNQIIWNDWILTLVFSQSILFFFRNIPPKGSLHNLIKTWFRQTF